VVVGILVCLCVRPAVTARQCRINVGGKGNALYPVLSSYTCKCYLSQYLLSGSVLTWSNSGGMEWSS